MTAADWSFDALRENVRTEYRPQTFCRCGWPNHSQLGAPPVRVPVLDLKGKPGSCGLESTPIRRSCAACQHPIQAGAAAVVHRPSPTSAVLNRYHPECVEIR